MEIRYHDHLSNMKKYLIILSFTLLPIMSMAQSNFYDAQWQEVKALLKKQQSQDAEKLVRTILSTAKKEQNKEQIIKSLIILRQSLAERDEQDVRNTIIAFENEISGLGFPEKNILHSMIASLYDNYYQRNRWLIFQRTEVATISDLKHPDDINTWTPQLFFNKIHEHFEASLGNAEKLLAYPITNYPELITPGNNATTLRPTLFDILVHRAIDYFSREEIDITKAAYYFKLTDTLAFADATTFEKIIFDTKDTNSSKHLVLRYLQLATRFHAKDEDPTALIDLESKRLEFVFEQFDGTNASSYYKASLEKIIADYPNNIMKAKLMLQLAEQYMINEKTIALRLAKEIQEHYPSSIEYAEAEKLISRILEKSLLLTTEEADIPNKNILALITFKNIETIYYKVIPITPEEFISRKTAHQANKNAPKGKPIRQGSIALDRTNWQGAQRFEEHRTEIKIDSVPMGTYAIMISGDKYFNEKKSPVCFALFQATQLSYVVSQNNFENELFVLDRNTGAPIANAAVTRYKNEYDYDKRQNIKTVLDTRTTNASGQITYPFSNHSQFELKISNNEETLWVENAFYAAHPNIQKDRTSLSLFTDRAIYRPGQSIYFKGILIQSAGDGREHDVIKNKEITVKLMDANFQQVEEASFTTNEFGSINGIFTSPQGLLNGIFTLLTEYGSKQIRVEEYKRPTFEVSLDKLSENVKLNDEVKISGQAKAYSGAGLQSAKVTYNVTRKVRWPYYWSYSLWGVQQNDQDIVVSSGETITNQNGIFFIDFLADDDPTISKKSNPFYDFVVNVDVLDINGEVRSSSATYTIANQSLILSFEIPEQADIKDFSQVAIRTTNTQGVFTPANVHLDIIKLKEPERFLKSRFWSAPEEKLLSPILFKEYFPDYAYDKENNPLFWDEEQEVWSTQIQTKDQQPTILPNNILKGGYYLIKATSKDKDGQLVEEKKIIRLINDNSLEATNNEALVTTSRQKDCEVGDEITIGVASNFTNANILKTIIRQDKQTIRWDEGAETMRITDKDRGGLILHYLTVWNNRIYQQSVPVQVPWSNKDLEITYETFRDKILPGSPQEWRLKISGHKKEKVSAELLIAMYDASLDAFAKNEWNPLKLYQHNYYQINWRTNAFNTARQYVWYDEPRKSYEVKYRAYPGLNMFGLLSNQAYLEDEYVVEAAEVKNKGLKRIFYSITKNEMQKMSSEKLNSDNANSGLATVKAQSRGGIITGAIDEVTAETLDQVALRKDLAETAFFLPDLKTDENGNLIFSFTAPEALSRWNLKTLAHTTDLKTAMLEKTLVTQKQLMITPNHPRFMREGDQIMYSIKLSNLSNKKLEGNVRLQIIHAITNENIDNLFQNKDNTLAFNLAAQQNGEVVWPLHIPARFTDPVIVRIVAKADDYSDGEQQAIPILLNSILVTKTLPLPVRINTTGDFSFEKLKTSASSSTLQHHRLTLEYTSNPAWYAVQALPYLTDYPYECSEQTFNRYYANALASHIANSHPRIQQIFSKWQEKDSTALLSQLEKNQELKSALLQETPWVLEAKNESEQKRMLVNLFNLNRMQSSLEHTVSALEKLQTPNGGFSWFSGMKDNEYITLYIVTGIARLQQLGVTDAKNNPRIIHLLNKALAYCDQRMVSHYEYLQKQGLLKNNNLSYLQIQYLYMRSFFQEVEMNNATRVAFNYFKEKSLKHWTSYNRYMQGMLAISLHRYHDNSTAQSIMEALRQNAIQSNELGMYWKEFNQGSYWWHEAPIEAHSLLIEAFTEIPPNTPAIDQLKEVEELKIWLLKQKQTQHWKTTKATADACYALLLNGANWLAEEPEVKIQLGSKHIDLSHLPQEAGTGYTKINIDKNEIQAAMGNIRVQVTGNQDGATTWGAVYWQYFEQLDRISESSTPLSLTKQLYKVINTERGEELVLLKNDEEVNIGDKIKVRIELRVDRRMEYVHMKDMRGACFEPTNVLSNYKYQGGLSYYESTKDAATQFFFDKLNPGTYVFEYCMFSTIRGDFSNGIATIQCMYAPEFSSHSEGIKIKVN